MAIQLFTNAIAAALSQALVSLSEDPLLVWNYAVTAILAFVFGIAFYIAHRGLDKEEDELNMLPDSAFGGKDRKHSAETDPEH